MRAVVVFTEDRMWYVTVADDLYWAVVVLQLLSSNDVGVVAVHMAIDAHDISHNTRYSTKIVRHHEYCHL